MATHYLNTVWGHIVYRTKNDAKWTVPKGMTTLQQFLEWHKKRFNLDQKQRDKPLALEVYFSIVLPRILTDREVGIITMELTGELEGEGFGDIARFMEWGYEYSKVDASLDGKFESVKRYSRDGEDFSHNEHDTTDAMRTMVRVLFKLG